MTTSSDPTRDDSASLPAENAALNGDDVKLAPLQWLVQQIDEIFADVTDEEWAEWPETDASEQLDHYLYGSPKRETRKFKSDATTSAKMSPGGKT